MTADRGLDGRHRDAEGRIDVKHRNTLIGTLRQTYGPGFAPGMADQHTLDDLLRRTGAPSLSQYLQDRRG